MHKSRFEKRKRGLVAALRTKLAHGEPDSQIQEDLQVNEEEYLQLLEELYRQDADKRFNKPPEQAYIDYCLRQEGCIKDLNSLVRKCRKGRQYQAMVSAIRAKSDILDRVVQRGQEFGVLNKVPEQHQIVAGVAVAKMDDAQLRASVVEQLETLRAMQTRYGEVPLLEAHAIPLRKRPVAPVVEELNSTAPEEETPEVEMRGRPHRARGGVCKSRGGHKGQVIKRMKAKSAPTR